MFGTSIHWTTFFYLLLDTVIVLCTIYYSTRKDSSGYKRFLYLGILFIAYNLTGGFLPTEYFLGPIIIQYIITYGVAIALCIYIVYYLYKEYDIEVLKYNSSIRNLAIVASGSFVLFFLIPYFFTNSLDSARLLFTVPIACLAFVFLWIFHKRISNPSNPNDYILRRIRLSMVSIGSIALLPILTVIGDYQWLTFTIMNAAFYAITIIEIDRYLYFLENKTKMYEVFAMSREQALCLPETKIIYEDLTRREIEITLSILSNLSYKRIAKDLFIAESTVSKHASNIYKKTGVKNRRQFIHRYRKKSK
ncbi:MULTISPECIES: helix-turn-helix transcriptional regulator [Flavobacteriaceae]|jgi:DNA-binding CsgD family transcriptional regulator|uniref:Helix-turn-helix transcriptional regulator n=1 Tax=Autumnicola patrickiae TaxID=3075591 RepID=A0ABU3E7W1_9FLAO|nr:MULTISPECIES: helix-turn-helix transcriptional regulator [Flavobacteriaceae]MAN25969.1 helix-turn-helix transcriptional regulator [Mesonia sp.]MDT0691769.1 helix-turn-helix transcriptional regulator [Salegentibacter sp. F188]|tara:strand:+ start:5112 stop:6029 length:918 start_codon:yes stop_codon:yes gene_type:complete